MAIFLSDSNIVKKPLIHQQTKKHLPKVKKKEGEAPKADAPKTDAPKPEAKPEEKT